MIRLRGQLIALTDGDAAAVRQNLPDHTRLTKAEPGNLSFEVTPTDDPMVWEVMETFRDRAAFDAHQVRNQASPWFTATRDCVRNYRIEEIGD